MEKAAASAAEMRTVMMTMIMTTKRTTTMMIMMIAEPKRGASELHLSGESIRDSFGAFACQFSCWTFDSTCSLSPTASAVDSVRPNFSDCVMVGLEGTGLFRTIGFTVLPKPESFDCVSRNWQSLNCTWKLTSGSAWVLNHESKGLVSFSYPCRQASNGICSYQNIPLPIQGSANDPTISLMVFLGTSNFSMAETYSFSLVIPTKFGDITGNYSVFSGQSITQYEAVEGLSVENNINNSTVLLVKWTLPFPARDWGDFVCWLQLQAVDAGWLNMNKTDINVTMEECERGQKTLTGLHPHVKYRVTLRFRDIQSAFLSDIASAFGTTSEDVPSRAPEVTAGGYMRSTCDTGDCLTVYPKALPPEYHNGILTSYEVEVCPYPNPWPCPPKEMITSRFPADADSLTVRLASAAGAFVCVRVGTSRGLSQERSCLEVASRTLAGVPKKPSGVMVDYHSSNNSYYVQWLPPAVESSLVTSSGLQSWHYIVFWCWGYSNKTVPLACRRDTMWQRVPANQTSLTVNGHGVMERPGSAGQDTWYFAVATVQGDYSAGLVLSHCTFDIENGLVKPPNFGFLDVQKREVTVTWDTKCEDSFLYARPSLIEMYYTDTSGNHSQPCTEGNTTEVIPQPGQQSFKQKITGFQPGVALTFCLLTITARGRSDVSPSRLVTLKQEMKAAKESENEDLIWKVGITPVLGLIVLAAIFLAYKYPKEKRKFLNNYQPSERQTETKRLLYAMKFGREAEGQAAHRSECPPPPRAIVATEHLDPDPLSEPPPASGLDPPPPVPCLPETLVQPPPEELLPEESLTKEEKVADEGSGEGSEEGTKDGEEYASSTGSCTGWSATEGKSEGVTYKDWSVIEGKPEGVTYSDWSAIGGNPEGVKNPPARSNTPSGSDKNVLSEDSEEPSHPLQENEGASTTAYTPFSEIKTPPEVLLQANEHSLLLSCSENPPKKEAGCSAMPNGYFRLSYATESRDHVEESDDDASEDSSLVEVVTDSDLVPQIGENGANSFCIDSLHSLHV